MKSFCRICEVGCGSVVSVSEGSVTVRPDPENPYSQGYFCKKGLRGAFLETDPDRLRHPLLRSGPELRRASWREALDHVGRGLRSVADSHGPTSIAVFAGNSSAYSGHLTLAISRLLRGLESDTVFSALSVDCISRYYVAAESLGLLYSVPVPFYAAVTGMVVLGSNVTVNQWSPGGSTPGGGGVANALRRRGGWLGVVDPQRHAIGRMADAHMQIAPGTNATFLAALLNYVWRHGGVDRAYVARYCHRLEAVWEACRDVEVGDASETCGIDASDLASFFERVVASRAVLLDRGGVSMGRNSTVASGLTLAINASLGLIDVPHGFHIPDYSPVRGRAGRGRPHGIRYGREWPSALLASAIDGRGAARQVEPALPPVRALVVVAGNPMRSLPNTARLERALRNLDLLVVLDIYETETAQLADAVLPGTSHYQRADFNFLSSMLTPDRYKVWTDAVTAIEGQERPEMWISNRMVAAFRGEPIDDSYADFRDFLGERIQGSPDAWAGGEVEQPDVGRFLREGFPTDTGKMEFDRPWINHIRAALEEERHRDASELVLLGRRIPHGVNSVLHNAPDFAERGNPMLVSPTEAARLHVEDGDEVQLRSPTGATTSVVRVSDEVPPRSVVLSHGWGHRGLSSMSAAASAVGGNVNALTRDEEFDPFTGMPIYHGYTVSVRKLTDEPTRPAERPG